MTTPRFYVVTKLHTKAGESQRAVEARKLLLSHRAKMQFVGLVMALHCIAASRLAGLAQSVVPLEQKMLS